MRPCCLHRTAVPRNQLGVPVHVLPDARLYFLRFGRLYRLQDRFGADAGNIEPRFARARQQVAFQRDAHCLLAGQTGGHVLNLCRDRCKIHGYSTPVNHPHPPGGPVPATQLSPSRPRAIVPPTLREGYRVKTIACALALTLAATAAAAQTYPDRALKMLIPLAAGSAVDAAARITAEGMAAELGQSIVVENMPGASGQIGMRTGARATPDGYTILGVNDSILAMLPNIKGIDQVGYDPFKDFAPVTQMVTVNFVVMAHPSFAPNNIREFVALAKEKPGTINFGSGGPGSPQHVVMEMLMQATGIKLNHVPYRGLTPAVNDTVSGHLQLMIAGLPTPIPFAEAGRLKLLAATSATRLKVLPNLPTIAEQGVPGFDFTTWGAIVVPAKTPGPIVARLNAAAVAALRKPEIEKRLTDSGYDVVANTPQQFAEKLRTHYQKIGEIVKSANIRID